MITINDIKEGAKFKTSNGIVWIIDSIENSNYGLLVSTSMAHGAKGNYRNEINDCVAFLNEEGATEEFPETDADDFDEQDQRDYDNLNRNINGQIEEI